MAEPREEKEQEVSEIAAREEAMLAFWNERGIFEKSVKKEAPHGEYIFYDGPPFATGLPHHGHILAGTIKDTIPRYRTMRGYSVPRKWGWDCHGLPLENLVEKELGLKTKKDIEDLGIEMFNENARSMVLHYADDWKRIIPRLGRWVDMEHDYKTMDSIYTESVWWVFAELNRKGLVYEGFKPMHLCPRCGTTLSNFEVNQGYKDIKDIAVTVKLELKDEPGTYLLVWTTTPWTLPGNMAAAVHEDFDYVKAAVKTDDGTEKVILAKEQVARLPEGHTVLETFKGKELLGKAYVPPFDYYKDGEKTAGIRLLSGDFKNAWKIYHAPYVSRDDGTGAVHLAPVYGDEDTYLAQKENVPLVHHVDTAGKFMAHVTDLAGQPAKPKDDKDAGVEHTVSDVEILKMLKSRNRLFSKENIVHSYPLCWRCETPLLVYATSSWFVRVTDIKDKLVAENNKIRWVPEHVGSARFGNWLEGARDWAVSRQRYWGAPLPVWRNTKSDACTIFGSRSELISHTPKSGNTYFLMRHGEAESNAHGVSSTKRDAQNPLTDQGRKQVEACIETLKTLGIDRIVASPYERTRVSAELVADGLGIARDAIEFDERLGEIQLGVWDGATMKDYHRFLGDDGFWGDRRPEGGESWNDVKRRAGAVLYELERTYRGGKILILAHNSPLRMLCAVAKGESLNEVFDHDDDGKRFGNAEIRDLDFTPLPHNRDFVLDYHRPYIDEYSVVDTDGTPMVRVPDVFDCWFESGSMPYGQQHYPFENLGAFEPKEGKGYPADFIAESVDQTRGWFYSMIVLGTALFGHAPYKNVITNGLVLAEDGRKMSKSLKNYPDPIDVVNKYGADTLRFYLLSSPIIRGEDLNFSEKNLAELARKNLGRLANVLSFYELYRDKNVACDGTSPSGNVLDQWILARLSEITNEITAGMENYELDRATRPVTGFIDDLSVWYLRRSRERLKYGDEKDQDATLATLRYVLRTLALLMAPSMPFFAEYLYQAVREDADPESVHLAAWPEAPAYDLSTIEAMKLTRDIVTKALEARTEAGIKVRQPLKTLYVRHELVTEAAPYHELIKAEVNVKELVSDMSLEREVKLDTNITKALKDEGEVREVMRYVQDMRKEAGLVPEDTVTLTIETDAGGQANLEDPLLKEQLMRTVNAESIIFGSVEEGGELKLEARTYRVALKKL